MQAKVYVGIDIAKAQLDIALRPSGQSWQVRHEEAGIEAVVEQLRAQGASLIVVEATGGLETAVAGALAGAGLPVVIVNPRQVRAFAKATGQLAKTDQLDAQVLAHFAEAIRPPVRPLADRATQDLAALVRWRARLGGPPAATRDDVDRGAEPPQPGGGRSDAQGYRHPYSVAPDPPPAGRGALADDLTGESRVACERPAPPERARGWAHPGHDLVGGIAGVRHLGPPPDCGLGRRRPLQPRQWNAAGPPPRLGGPSPRPQHAVPRDVECHAL